jgi:hypothetical protein
MHPGVARALILLAAVAAGGVPGALAQERASGDGDPAGALQPAPSASPFADPPAVRTGKERLGRKWMDEQRLDNCKVPADRRGTTPRPDACPPDAAE